MALSDYAKLKGFDNGGDALLSNILEANLKEHFDWGFLNKGMWYNVNVPTSGIFGGDKSTLKPVLDVENYTDGQVWQSAKTDWVWQTGVEFSGGNDPIVISGVYINSSFYPSVGGSNPHHINYPLGRVIFNTAIPTGSTVQAAYSYRWVQVARIDDVPWFKELQYSSFRVDDDNFSRTDKGEWHVGANHRLQLPSIIIEPTSRGYNTPYEMGNTSLRAHRDIKFTVVAEDGWTRNQMMDMLMNQEDRVIWLYDLNDINVNQDFPLDYRGMLIGDKMYPELINTYPWYKCYFKECNLFEVDTLNPYLHVGGVRITFEVILENI